MPATRIAEFDLWRPGYGGATVRVEIAGTSTLASIFSDEALSVAVDNPVTLSSTTIGGISYGKFSAPIYIGVAYELVINSTDQTGIVRVPLTTLTAADASLATVQVAGGTQDIELEDHLARRIDVRDFGAFVIVGGAGASSSTNNATLVAAMAAASSAGGGFVEVPAGTYAVTTFTVPTGVVLRGQGRNATILQSTSASAVATIGGSRAGFSRITLDGSTLVGSSIGVYAANKDEVVFDDVEVKRFETGISRKGGTRSNWHDLYISNCVTGYAPYGDLAAAAGGALRFNSWRGGKIDTCSTAGIDLKYVDAATEHNQFHGITFDTNTGKAVWVRGARWTQLRDCRWIDNTNNLTVADISPATNDNTVIGLDLIGGEMSGGTVTLNDTLEAVSFRNMALTSVTVTLTTPVNNVVAEDVREVSVTIAGTTTAWRRQRLRDKGSAAITTTDASTTKIWEATLEPGQHAYLEGKAIGRQINGLKFYGYHFGMMVKRPSSLLNYEAQTGNFTLGQVITGGTSGATARLVGQTDAGATGQLLLYDITGAFVDDELITDPLGGSATTNGILTTQNAVILTVLTMTYNTQTANFTVGARVTGATSGATGIISADSDGGASGTLTVKETHGQFIATEIITDTGGGSATLVTQGYATACDIRTEEESASTAYAASFIASGTQIEFRVTGAASETVAWTCDIDMTVSHRTL